MFGSVVSACLVMHKVRDSGVGSAREKDNEDTFEVKVLHNHVILHVTQMSRNGMDVFNILHFHPFNQCCSSMKKTNRSKVSMN